jgi:hypothetical protein
VYRGIGEVADVEAAHEHDRNTNQHLIMKFSH